MIEILAFLLAPGVVPAFEPVQPPISDPVREASAQRDTMSLEEWLARFNELGEGGDASALEMLGELYALGITGVPRDPVRACDYFEMAGNRRGDSLHSLAGCYHNGEGRTQDDARARELYRQAIEAGYLTSLCGLGTMLVHGRGGPVNAEEGVALCRQAAELGDKNAQTDLGGFLLTGQGVARDPVEARLWLEEAGGQGQANAAHLLGQIYTRGDGVGADHERAAYWFRNAHAEGRVDSAWLLARSLLRMGYTQVDGEISINPAMMRESVEFALIAAQHDPDPAIRIEAAAYAEAANQLIASAGD
ncbi:MAG: tetratricopeptide repeat protein [Alteraurantiacibacter sp.]